MNHTPHILASVFLCGLWLPIWILIAVTYQDTWRCSSCGFSDAVKYLQNPRLREHEQIAAEQKRIMNERRAEENQRFLAAMPLDTPSDKTAYIWAAYKIPILAVGGAVVFIGFLFMMSALNSPRSSPANNSASSSPGIINQSQGGSVFNSNTGKYDQYLTQDEFEKARNLASNTPPTSAPAISKPYFNAASLAGKTPREVPQLLGRQPTDAWDSDDGPGIYMQTYAIGEDMTVEFRGNRINSLVIFFPNDVGRETAHQLVGLDSTKGNPKGIKNISSAQNWIKVFYSR